LIRNAVSADIPQVYEVINDAAIAYKGIIAADRWHDPYMPLEELQAQIADGVKFSCYVDSENIIGVMGIQDKGEVNLIRHAYVKSQQRKSGIGTQLLQQLIGTSNKPILIGTWTAATWAISFYEKHGFNVVSPQEKEILLRKFWSIPQRQIEESVVLADERYFRDRQAH
jgi:N-acetylglutamate synthase-like GNAT family acetyltransferase